MRLTVALVVLAGCVEPAPELATVDQEVTGAKCPDGETIQGIDVSEYQESVDWAQVKASGRVFGIARINVGDHLDPYFQDNWDGMRAAGMIRGAYQYYKPSFDPVQQANLVVSTVGVLGPDDLPAMLDIEILDGVAPAEVVSRLRTWLDIVEAGTGKRPLVYTGAYFWDDNIGSTALADYPLVIPWYGTNCPGVPDAWDGAGWKFHQYSETGTVPGVSSNPTDLDVFNGSEAELRAWIAPSASCGAIPASGGTIDDDHPCFRTGGPSQYLHRVSTAGEGGGLIWTHATAEPTESNFAEWRLDLEAAGRYEIEVYTAAAFAQSRQARYVVTAGGAATDVVIDQTAVDGWQSLGELDLAAGGGQSVHLGDNTGEAESAEVQLVFDAVRLTPVGGVVGPDAGPGDGEPGDGGCNAGGGGSLGVALVALLSCLSLRRRGSRLEHGDQRFRRSLAAPAQATPRRGLPRGRPRRPGRARGRRQGDRGGRPRRDQRPALARPGAAPQDRLTRSARDAERDAAEHREHDDDRDDALPADAAARQRALAARHRRDDRVRLEEPRLRHADLARPRLGLVGVGLDHDGLDARRAERGAPLLGAAGAAYDDADVPLRQHLSSRASG